MQLLVLFASIEISKIFHLKIYRRFFSNFYNKKKNRVISSYLIFFLSFFFLAHLSTFIDKENGLQILNFIIFLISTFELCLKIGKTEKFENWIGYGLDQNLRIFVMFIISLNVIYFLTRITFHINNVNFS